MLLSGGIDSTTALYVTRRRYIVRALTFVYHGIARREVESAKAIAAWGGVADHRLVRLPDLREAGDVGLGAFRGLPPTYISMRNSIFYSYASSYAEETGAVAIVGGHNRDDEEVFQDTRPEFFAYLEKALRTGSPILRRNRLRISRPLRLMTKPEVVRLAASKGIPLELTWSCHRDGREHCWRCEGCLSRERAFLKAGVKDPLRM